VLSGFIVSWSGGKESALSLYRALNQGIKISHMVSFVSNDGRSMSHALKVELLEAQSQALGIPLVTKKVTWETYEQGFKELVHELKPKGIEGCVFGDVWVAEHREWTERVCSELEIKALSPLFSNKPENLFRELINLGFQAVVIVVKKEFLGDEWLGRKLDQDFLNELLEIKESKNVDVLGELGEYHTFVYDGPIFKKRIALLKTRKVPRNGYTYLDITNFKLLLTT
jgi:uncharacterized protein (TIGR00290 family)